MRRFFLNENLENKKLVAVCGDQFLHMTKVLRMKIGERFIAICGDGNEYTCEITFINENEAKANILEVNTASTDAKTNVTVFQACVKGDKFDLIIQKLSELGIKKIIPFDSDFAIAKCIKEKTERYNKIATEACKQCKRTIPLVVEMPLSFKQMIEKIQEFDLVLFFNEHEDSLSLKNAISQDVENVAIIVGSEGGFSDKEINSLLQTKAKSITLGKRILRAETAAIAGCACVMMELGELE